MSFGSKLCHSKAIKSILKATSKLGTEHKMCMLSQPDNYRKMFDGFLIVKKNTQHNRKIIISSLNIKYIRFTSRIKLFLTARFLIYNWFFLSFTVRTFTKVCLQCTYIGIMWKQIHSTDICFLLQFLTSITSEQEL